MPSLNSFTCNGKSTADFPFYIAVIQNAPPMRAKKKDKIYDLPHVDGVLKQSVNAFESVEREYIFYLHEVDYKQTSEFLSVIGDEGWFTPSDIPDLRFIYKSTHIQSDPLDAVNGYEITIRFVCEPYGYEEEITKLLGNSITNHTNAPMYPLIEIRGQTGSETYLTIGEQTMYFKEIQDVIKIECKHGYQDVVSSGGRKINQETRGDFFRIPPGTHSVAKGNGITSVTITERWGWL